MKRTLLLISVVLSGTTAHAGLSDRISFAEPPKAECQESAPLETPRSQYTTTQDGIIFCVHEKYTSTTTWSCPEGKVTGPNADRDEILYCSPGGSTPFAPELASR